MSKTNELIQRFLGEPARNLMHAMYDDYVEANVRFRSRAGVRTFIVRREMSKCCEWCAGLAGIYESDKAPEGVYQRHDNCKCMVTFRNEKGKYTDAWSKKEFDTQKKARISRIQEIERSALANPSKVKKATSWEGIPKKNTEADLLELKQFALDKGIALDQSFMYFDGDIDLVKDFIETIDENIKGRNFRSKKRVKLNVTYTMTDDTYAETSKSKITINGFAFRDRELLKKAYAKKVEEEWFPQGSKYLDIATHESGHLIVNLEQLRTKDVATAIFGKNEQQASVKIMKHISEYASLNNSELIAEAYVAYKCGSRDEYVLKVLEYTGII